MNLEPRERSMTCLPLDASLNVPTGRQFIEPPDWGRITGTAIGNHAIPGRLPQWRPAWKVGPTQHSGLIRDAGKLASE